MTRASDRGGEQLFALPADHYDRFMGRWSERLAPLFADFAGVDADARPLDVGCGTGTLTAELARRVEPEHVAAVDPAPQFVEACRRRVPGADVRPAPAEALPFADGTFDVALAQLVVAFMDDPDAGLAEMRRVVRPGGVVAVCTWSVTEMGMLSAFWDAARTLPRPEGSTAAEPARYRTREEIEGLAERGGFEAAEMERLTVERRYEGFDDFWEPITTAAGPAGAFYRALDAGDREALREACRERLGDPCGPFTLSAVALALRARV